ncbi:unnamed protein product [Eruca vesicaria subsp. sativa]|uniref:Uncharacterized protein n=1 Tax=Eruca vesicaria subsp. sativa TaxID=29727 RepID=A0ABC8J6V7_ERUVS|nr:unnamed protein product [Eruca vesicaria subsp. sativa]
MVMGAPLVDARHLAERYERMRQETGSQTIEVSKRKAKVRENSGKHVFCLYIEAFVSVV